MTPTVAASPVAAPSAGSDGTGDPPQHDGPGSPAACPAPSPLSEQLDQMRAQMDTLTRELRKARRLEAIGRLSSGIAHEINSPLQYITSNLHFARTSVEDLLALVDTYRDAARVDGEVPEALRQAEAERGLDFLLEQLGPAIDQTFDGLERVSKIVRTMREFGVERTGDRKEPADLNRALRSALVVAHNELKYVATVQTDLQPIPHVTCFEGDLNLVFLNLLTNAAHGVAAAVKGTHAQGTITVCSRDAGDDVVEIAVSDTGCGIPPDDLERLLGAPPHETGASPWGGLAVARAVIVDEHAGTLTIDSEQGRGTTVTIRLPVEPPGDIAETC